MKLTFIGADHEVTGSAHFLQACGKNVLVDYGMEQGLNVFENAELPVQPAEIDFILITHAHIDHTGMIPALYVKGFRGTVIATNATCELCQIMLRDSANIQEFEAEWRNRKLKRAGKDTYVPAYTVDDVEGVLGHFKSLPYDKRVKLCDGIDIEFTDVGHLLGSASIKLWVYEGEEERSIVFSGDIGNKGQPLIRDPQYTYEADYVVMESTYGNRLHSKERPDYVAALAETLQETFDRGGNVVIPSFAVGRTQELLYYIRKIKEADMVKPSNFEVYVDSPLAIEATHVFKKNISECFNDEAVALVDAGINPISFPGLKLAVSTDQSVAINFDPKPKVILSASGMCEAGRIRHHLKHNLWRKESCILFVGYQAYGTLGRALVEGANEVTLFGEEIGVQAEIKVLAGISGHADKEGLLAWINAFEQKPKQVFVVHGEDVIASEFVKTLEEEYGYVAKAPYSGSQYDLVAGEWIYEAKPIPIKKKERSEKVSSVFERLVSAGQRLLGVISMNKGGANKDLAKFTDQINSLCDKWER